jgi:integrase
MLALRKRGRIYHVRGTIRVGRQVRDIREHSTGCRDRAAAEAYRAKLEGEVRAELLHGRAAARRAVTFEMAALGYLEDHRPRNRPAGLHPNDVWRLGELGRVLGAVPLEGLAAAWPRFVRQRCAGLASSTIDRFRATLTAAVRHHCRPGPLPELPARERFKNERQAWLTEDERERLIGSYAAHVQPIVIALAYTGARCQEALQLRWRDVDLGRGVISFLRTKSGQPRDVALRPRVRSAIERLRLERREVAPQDRVFLNVRGLPYADTRDYRLPGGNPLRQAHRTACRRAGIAGFRLHDWRHDWATRLVRSGCDLITLQKLGGWSDMRMLQRYVAVQVDHQADQIRKLA